MKYVLFAALTCMGLASAWAATPPADPTTPTTPPDKHNKERRVSFDCEFRSRFKGALLCQASGEICVHRNEHNQLVRERCHEDDLNTNSGRHHDEDEGRLFATCTDYWQVDAEAFATFRFDRDEERELEIHTERQFNGRWWDDARILIDDFDDDDFRDLVDTNSTSAVENVAAINDGHRNHRETFRARFSRDHDGDQDDWMWGYCRLFRDDDHHDRRGLAQQ